MRQYSAGSWIPVIVDITTNHGGFFIFKLCHNDDITQDPDQECFETNILQVSRARGLSLVVIVTLFRRAGTGRGSSGCRRSSGGR